MTLTQHAHIYRIPTSNFNFGQFIFLFFLSMQPLLGGIFDACGGGGRHGQLVTGRSISMSPPALTPLKHHNQLRFGSVGAESPREQKRLRFVVCIFFGIMAGGGILRHH